MQTDQGNSAEAKIIDILEHSLTAAVGQLVLDEEKPKYAGYIRSKNQQNPPAYFVKKPALVLDGTEVLKVAIDKYPTKKRFFVASLVDVVGHVNDPGMMYWKCWSLWTLSPNFQKRSWKRPSEFRMHDESDLAGRLDLRDEITFTIDGADAKDLDDAVHIKRLKNGNFELGVHIADVSYYVKEALSLTRKPSIGQPQSM